MAGAPQGGQTDNSMGILWGIVAIFAALGFVWYGFHEQLKYVYLTIKLYEIDFLNAVTGNRFETLHSEMLYAFNNMASLSFADVVNMGQGVGSVLRYPLGLLMMVLAIVVYASNSARVYRRTYSMKDLVKLEQVNWPQIGTVANLDLLKVDIDVGPWAMALQPMQYCKRYRLIDEVRPQRREGMARKEWDKVEVRLRRGDATRLFVMQLGQLWKGTAYLPPYAKALFAVFAARINADTDEAARLIKQFNLSATNKSIDMRSVDDVIKKHEQSKLVQKIVNSHAYVFTVMAAMLAGARDDGVQASADFLWLKPIDRRLWYTLNVVGRQTPFVEVAGIFAHYVAEKEADKKLLVPMVEEATNALEGALKEVLYKPDEKVE